jgi:hypothetical protein
MNVKARMLLESALDLGMLVRGVVVDDKMQLLVLRSRIVWNILTSVARGIGCSRGWGGVNYSRWRKEKDRGIL